MSETEKQKQRPSALRIANIAAAAVMAAVTYGMLIYILVTGNDPHKRLIVDIFVPLLFLLPFAGEWIFRRKLSDFTLTFYFGYVFAAALLGNVLMLYNVTAWYDKVAHFLFGYVGCTAGLFILCKLADEKALRPALVALFCFAVSMMCGAIWEIYEFSVDNLLGQTAQGFPVTAADGRQVTDVTDTMLDLICNLGGAIVFTAHYAAHKLSGKNLLMGSIVRDFSRKSEKTKRTV